MRLQLITHSYLPESTPPQRRWEALVQAFRAAGWHVDVVAPPPDPRSTPGRTGGPPGRKYAPVDTRYGPSGERLWRTLRLPGLGGTRDGRFLGHIVHALTAIPVALRTPRPDVLVITVPALPTVVAGWAVSRLRRVPLVVEMRDAWPDLARDSGVRAGALSRLMERLVNGVQRAADQVVTVTEGFAERLRERGVSPVTMIGNSVVLEAIPQIPLRCREAGELHVLYLGNHGESQGLETVLQAAALLRHRPENITVRLVGAGTRRTALAELNRSLGFPAQMLGPAHGPGLVEQYEWADTCVVALRPDWPSFEWTIPSKTYELLAIDRHITGAVRGEAARLLEDSGAADLVPADAEQLAALWRRLAADPASTDPRGRGRRWVAAHADLPVLGGRFVEMAAELIERPRRRGGRRRGLRHQDPPRLSLDGEPR